MHIQKENPEDALFKLVKSYNQLKHYDEALKGLRKLISISDDLENKAYYVLYMGTLMEKKEDFKAAVRYYRKALRLEPTNTQVLYFINKNLGISLEGQLRFNEAAVEYVDVVRVTPDDCRPLKHLEALLDSQPELKSEFAEQLKSCRQLVDEYKRRRQIKQKHQQKYDTEKLHPV